MTHPIDLDAVRASLDDCRFVTHGSLLWQYADAMERELRAARADVERLRKDRLAIHALCLWRKDFSVDELAERIMAVGEQK